MAPAANATDSPSYPVAALRCAGTSLARLVWSPRHSRRAEAARRLARHSLMAIGLTAVVIIFLMFIVDAREIALMPARGTAGLWPFKIITDFGKSDYVLITLGLVLLLLVLLAPLTQGTSRATLIGFGSRVLYIFLSVAITVYLGELIKGVVGRGRPFVGGSANPFKFSHFSWDERYASFPSGHALTAFALAFAVSAVWPRLRVPMFIYALVIIASRLVLLAHHPSDVVAGALIGIVIAMAVRYWFAARRLGFAIADDGTIAPLQGASPRELGRIVRSALGA